MGREQHVQLIRAESIHCSRPTPEELNAVGAVGASSGSRGRVGHTEAGMMRESYQIPPADGAGKARSVYLGWIGPQQPSDAGRAQRSGRCEKALLMATKYRANNPQRVSVQEGSKPVSNYRVYVSFFGRKYCVITRDSFFPKKTLIISNKFYLPISVL